MRIDIREFPGEGRQTQWGNRKSIFSAFGRWIVGTLGDKSNIII